MKKDKIVFNPKRELSEAEKQRFEQNVLRLNSCIPIIIQNLSKVSDWDIDNEWRNALDDINESSNNLLKTINTSANARELIAGFAPIEIKIQELEEKCGIKHDEQPKQVDISDDQSEEFEAKLKEEIKEEKQAGQFTKEEMEEKLDSFILDDKPLSDEDSLLVERVKTGNDTKQDREQPSSFFDDLINDGEKNAVENAKQDENEVVFSDKDLETLERLNIKKKHDPVLDELDDFLNTAPLSEQDLELLQSTTKKISEENSESKDSFFVEFENTFSNDASLETLDDEKKSETKSDSNNTYMDDDLTARLNALRSEKKEKTEEDTDPYQQNLDNKLNALRQDKNKKSTKTMSRWDLLERFEKLKGPQHPKRDLLSERLEALKGPEHKKVQKIKKQKRQSSNFSFDPSLHKRINKLLNKDDKGKQEENEVDGNNPNIVIGNGNLGQQPNNNQGPGDNNNATPFHQIIIRLASEIDLSYMNSGIQPLRFKHNADATKTATFSGDENNWLFESKDLDIIVAFAQKMREELPDQEIKIHCKSTGLNGAAKQKAMDTELELFQRLTAANIKLDTSSISHLMTYKPDVFKTISSEQAMLPDLGSFNFSGPKQG